MIDPITKIILEKQGIDEQTFVTPQPGLEGLVGMLGPLKHLSRGEISDVFGKGGFALGALLAMYAFAAYKMFKEKHYKECLKFKGIEKDICKLKVRIKGKHDELSKLQKGLSFCNKARNSAKCKEKLNSKMVKVKAEIGKIQKALKSIK